MISKSRGGKAPPALPFRRPWVHLTTKTEVRWNVEKLECTTRLRTFIPETPSWNGTAKDSVQYRSRNEAGGHDKLQLFGNKQKDQPEEHQIINPPEQNSCMRNWQRGFDSIASTRVPDISAPVCADGVRPLLRLVGVAQKTEPLTMLSSNVQSIDLPMYWTAWRFWMVRQPIGCPDI